MRHLDAADLALIETNTHTSALELKLVAEIREYQRELRIRDSLIQDLEHDISYMAARLDEYGQGNT